MFGKESCVALLGWTFTIRFFQSVTYAAQSMKHSFLMSSILGLKMLLVLCAAVAAIRLTHASQASAVDCKVHASSSTLYPCVPTLASIPAIHALLHFHIAVRAGILCGRILLFLPWLKPQEEGD
jgi:hypothetical protein